MANEDASAVNDSAVQDTAAADSAPVEEKQLEVVSEGPALEPNDIREPVAEDTADDVADDTDEPEAVEEPQEPQDEQPLAPKSENRFQKLANENRELKAQLAAREAQIAQEQELINEINPETGDYYTPQEAERIAFHQSRQQQAQDLAQQRMVLDIQQNQMVLQNDAERVVNEFPLFNENSPEYNKELAAQADALVQQNLIVDQNGVPIGANVSPYEIYKTIATAYKASAVPNQIKGQKATEKMLSASDSVSSTKPSKSSANDADMSAEEYAKAHGLEEVWQ
jgi:hypothetical protein